MNIKITLKKITMKMFRIIIMLIVAKTMIYSEILPNPYKLEQNKKRLKFEYKVYKRISSGIKPIIFVSVNNQYYLLYDTSIELNHSNYLKRVFNDDDIEAKNPISTEMIKMNMKKENFISEYLQKVNNKKYFIVPKKFLLNTPFGNRSIKIEEIALAAQYLYDFTVIIINNELRIYNVEDYLMISSK